MSKRYKILAGLLILFLGLLVYAEASQKEPINWYESYGKQDKIPFGTYVFYEQLSTLLDEDRIEEVNIPPYEFLMDSLNPPKGTYFFVNSYIYNDEFETRKLLNWVARGNTLFMASDGFSEVLEDTLSLESDYTYDTDDLVKRPLVNLSNPSLGRKLPYIFDKDYSIAYFEVIDTLKTTVLGVADIMRDEDSTRIKQPKVNFIKLPFEEGEIILSTFPQAFTNYFMLQDSNADYTANVLSYLPKDGTIYIDQYYKNSKTVAVSPLFLILNNKYLKWSWYTLLLGALIWVIFEGKRKQRSIPVIKPLPNNTLDYTRTIAGMYLDKKENRQIATHQINHFMEYLRSTYVLATDRLNRDFIERLTAKSGKPHDTVQNTIDYIVTIRQKAELSEDELIRLNSLIENFKTTH
ncbi:MULTISPECIES: DUF4350 domain-containing protein [unclassified Leeuwenhoekiella]|uniref:DUF4350 domain-containing protein n=1 Tax=unclassified Leeuwenhoekiella TaxID=2615029 RepID=UPI000C57115E|nr:MULTISPECIES: DUF4350 domain-containing protein [unclassified Leeuwenhoekiella]MAW95158.1 hypothetical protein [Leeuwenhoekiella sp.]MBA81919.1 hypothetical protein [Leeuwenhoekiella sp.]|tara:strand:- start:2975 stop:4195 length:1221 start_codon:yes stop_codon:yes gene_type:complete